MGLVRSGTALSPQPQPKPVSQNPTDKKPGEKESPSLMSHSLNQVMFLEGRKSNLVWPFLHNWFYVGYLNFSMGWANKEL